MTLLEILGAIANAATAVGVGVAAWQLVIGRRQAAIAFEDSFTTQYRALIDRIPMQALLGEQLRPDELQELLPYFYRYFDLCNEQAFLHKHGRVSLATWAEWKDGIVTNIGRPAFRAAWSEVACRAPHDFDHLRELCPPAPVTCT